MITFEDFKKVEIKVGKILSAEKIPDTDKLLRLKVDFGMKLDCVPNEVAMKTELNECADIRQVVSGIAMYFPEPNTLVGQKRAFVTNLEPRKIKGFESQAMILAAGGDGEPFALFSPTEDVAEGSTAR